MSLYCYKFQGVLEGSGNADRLPTILIVAHYDTMAVAPVCILLHKSAINCVTKLNSVYSVVLGVNNQMSSWSCHHWYNCLSLTLEVCRTLLFTDN